MIGLVKDLFPLYMQNAVGALPATAF